jgi:hypothetical protein
LQVELFPERRYSHDREWKKRQGRQGTEKETQTESERKEEIEAGKEKE